MNDYRTGPWHYDLNVSRCRSCSTSKLHPTQARIENARQKTETRPPGYRLFLKVGNEPELILSAIRSGTQRTLAAAGSIFSGFQATFVFLRFYSGAPFLPLLPSTPQQCRVRLRWFFCVWRVPQGSVELCWCGNREQLVLVTLSSLSSRAECPEQGPCCVTLPFFMRVLIQALFVVLEYLYCAYDFITCEIFQLEMFWKRYRVVCTCCLFLWPASTAAAFIVTVLQLVCISDPTTA